MDINKLRNDIVNHHNLKNVDDIYTFYYDETNNIRKFYLTGKGFNVAKSDNFVLAGIMHKGNNCHADFSALFKNLRLQKSAKELKLKHIGKGQFKDLLSSKKLGIVFRWLIDNDFYIHYSNLNILYWSLIDIVESILTETREEFYINVHMSIKSDLYKVVKNDEKQFLYMVRKYHYPNVKADKVTEFSSWLLSFIKKNVYVLDEFRAVFLLRFFDDALSLNELTFIMDGHDDILIDDFLIFYLRTLYVFKNSQHIFDAEYSIEKLFHKFPLEDSGMPFCNYSFVDSETNKCVQISDVIAGFFGKYFTFLKDTDIHELKQIKSQLNDTQKENISLLRSLIDKSDELSEGLFHRVVSEEEVHKNNYFLYDMESF